MKIFHDETGVILEAAPDDDGRPGRSISVPDAELPGDFLANFALDAYRVSRGKLVRGREPVTLKHSLDELLHGNAGSPPDETAPEPEPASRSKASRSNASRKRR